MEALPSPLSSRANPDFLPRSTDHAGYTLLSIDMQSALRAGRLTAQHRDPFDRMLAAQALASDIPILSTDSRLDVFGIRRIWSDR